MDKTIATALLIAISMIMAVVLFNVAFPATMEAGDAITSMANRSEDRLKSGIEIIHASAELDGDGWWQDTNGNGNFDVFAWVKNIGALRFTALDRIDVFFGPEGNFARIPYQSEAGGSYPRWSYYIENDTQWTPTATVRITVFDQAPLPQGRYFLKVVLPNGISDTYLFGI